MTFDTQGCVVINKLNQNSDADSFTRRVSRSKALNGIVVIEDRGYTDGDRTIKAIPDALSISDANKIRYIAKTYSLINISTPDGFFSGVISSVSPVSGSLSITILIKEKLN